MMKLYPPHAGLSFDEALGLMFGTIDMCPEAEWATPLMRLGRETVREHLLAHGVDDGLLAPASEAEMYRIHDLYHNRGGDEDSRRTDRALLLACVDEVLRPTTKGANRR